MDFIHIADLHASKNRLEPCLQVLNKLFSYISSKEEKPALFIAGDFWDSVMQNTEASGFTRIFSAMKKIIDITKVVFVSGTPNHEPEGSLKIFEELGADVFYNPEIKDYGDFEIIAIPEPRRSNFQCSTIEEQSRQINASLDSFLESIPPKTKPRIVIYHGEVSGGVYQNGSNASSPIALSKERLQKADADYYALGHIHLPQELWKNCWYVGSCFPKDAGEHHKAGFHCVHIGPHATYFKRLSFGFAENVTEHVMYQNIDDIKAKKFKGKNLTLKVAIDKLLKKSFNKIELEEEIKEATGAESVRILFEYLEENNIRSNQLVTEKSLVEKFKIYCDINEIKYTDNTLLKLQEIQDNLIEESFVPCDTFELEYVSVRGAIGIRDGMGLDEFNLDFTKYDNGVLAIIGKNGGGKTTLLENCHPFPRMLTRSGALKEHFCLAKSHRILVYKTSAGKRIRIKMLINGVSNAENTRYFVETKEPDSDIWVAYKGVDGTLPSYKDWVNNTFGTYKMFLRTSFYANKYIKELPDLSIATKTEKMALFTTLAGIEYFTTVAETAKERAKAADEELKDLKKDVTNYDEIRERLRKAEDTIKENTQNIENEKNILDNDEKTLAEYQKKQEEFLRAVGSAGIIRKTLSEKKSDLVDVSKKIDNLRMDIESAEADLMRKDFFQQQLDWWGTSIKQEDEFKAERERQNTALTALATEKTELQLKEMQIKDKLSAIKEDIIRKEGELKLLKKNVHTINDVCPVCGEKLSEHKKEQLLKDNAETKKQIEKLQKDIEDLNTSKVPFEQDYEKTRYAIEQNTKDSITASGAIQEINVSLTQINSYRTEVDIEKAKYVIEQLQPEADRMSAALQEEIDKKKVIEEAIADLQKQEDSIPDDYSLKIQKVQDGILDSRDKITTWTSEINIANQVIEELTEKSKIIVNITSKAKEIEERLKDYTLIQKAFSYTGIQSLELDSTAPEISAIANDILAKSYGDRFTITFETQRDAKDGRKIDDFIIMVFDQKTGRRKELDMLSTGESIWIKQALYFAFSVIRSSRSGFCFKTRFIDESDGALDSEARPRYLKMLESAHESCGATLTVMVTHSQEIKDIVSQKLTLLE